MKPDMVESSWCSTRSFTPNNQLEGAMQAIKGERASISPSYKPFDLQQQPICKVY